jgi:hypothetical protein
VAFPVLSTAIAQARDIVIAIKNCKALLKALYDVQRAVDPTKHPLTLSLPGNTRKWSSGYLVISKVLRLQHVIVSVAGRADLPPIPTVDWNGMEIAKNALFEFYLTEQILQRDCSSAVHLSRLWDLLMRRAQNSRHAVLREAEQQEVFMKLGEGLRKRQEMMESSGVFYLCLALWPDPELTLQHHQYAFSNLKYLLEKQYVKWGEYRDAVSLPHAFATMTVQDFLLHARSDLTRHINCTDDVTRAARLQFRTLSTATMERLRGGEKMPLPRKWSDQTCRVYNVDQYWQAVGGDLPAIYFVYRILSNCCATEAATERVFSLESRIHNTLRNRMSPDLLQALMHVRWNYEPLMRVVQRLAPVEVDDDEDIPYD